MEAKRFFEIWIENNALSSGETEQLDKMQREFSEVFEGEAELFSLESECEGFWDYRNVYESQEGARKFFEKVGKNSVLPAYKFVVKYLLIIYRLAIGEDNLEGLWRYLEQEEWKLKADFEDEDNAVKQFRAKLERKAGENVVSFSNKDYEALLSVLLINLKKDYLKNGYKKKTDWGEKFCNLMTKLTLKELDELALGTNMTYELYRVFRKKVLRVSEINYYDHNQILVCLVLKYAGECGEYKLFKAHAKLKKLYPKNTTLPKAKKEIGTDQKMKSLNYAGTKQIGQQFVQILEEKGVLKKKFKNSLFEENSSEIKSAFDMVDSLDRKEKTRTAEKNFKKLWEKFEKALQTSDEIDFIRETLNLSENEEILSDVEVKIGKQAIYRWLYGNNVIQRAQNRNIEIKDKEMVKMGTGDIEHFLDSRIFLETRIRDNTFSAFPNDEERQRNLLLTVIFLNFVLEVDYLAEDYVDRVMDFEIAAAEILADSGFLLVYSGHPYDAFLMNLLSCDMPFDLFRFVWRAKTNSVE